MKSILHRKKLYLLGLFSVPILFLSSPSWLTIGGVKPSWAILWLLPWALEEGSFSGAMAGFVLGLFLDSICLGSSSHIPVLFFLGFWWGRLGSKGPLIERSLSLGLLAFVGTLFLGFSLWFQMLFLPVFESNYFSKDWVFNVLISQTLITGLLSPIVCTLLLLFLRYNRTKYK